MTLSEQDRKQFFSLFLPLLDYVNKKSGAKQSVRSIIDSGYHTHERMRGIAQKLWADTAVLDEYLALPEKAELPQEDKEIILGWKRHINGSFILERHLARGSIFIDTRAQAVYLVKGITDSWAEMIPELNPPISLEATLLPFKGVIISDGLVMIHRVSFGSHYKNACQEIYWNARQNGTIQKSI